MNALTQVQTNTIIKEIQDSQLAPSLKTYYVSLIQRAAEATNGVSQEEKLQACSELSFAIVSILISKELKTSQQDEASKNGWIDKAFDVVVKCKNQIVASIGIVSFALIFRPELSSILTSIFK